MELPDKDTQSEPSPPPSNLGIFDRINNYILLFYAAACLLMNYSLAGFLYFKQMVMLSLWLPGILSILVPFYLLSQRSPFGFVREFRLTAPDVRTLGLAVVISGAAIVPIDAFSSIFERMWPPDADYTSFILSIKPKGAFSFFVVSLGIVLAASVTEELLFRGFIQRIFERNMGGPLAVIFAGLLFGLSHFNPPALPGVTALGILLGYLFYKTQNLWYPILAHAVFNMVTLVRLNAMTEQEITSSKIEMPPVSWVAVSAAAFIVALVLLRRLYTGRGAGADAK
jgi:membrane protease YdiL (CAAX protease family)